MYTLYTDKSEDFKCNIGVEGATIKNTSARLVLENQVIDLLFEGKVKSDGTCIIPIKQLKNILPEGTSGNMKLEVIADGTFFSPWEDSFEIKVNKKVTVEVMSDTKSKPITETKINVKVSGPTQRKKQKKVVVKSPRSHSETLSEVLNKKGITLKNFSTRIDEATPLIKKYIKKYKVDENFDTLLNEVIINLK